MRVILFLFLAFNLNAQCDSLDINKAIFDEDAEFTAGVIRLTYTDSTGVYTSNFELRNRTLLETRDSLILFYTNLKLQAETTSQNILSTLIDANTMADKWAKLIAILENNIDEP